MAELKLKRLEHCVLLRINENGTAAGSGATEVILEKLVVHGLLIATAMSLSRQCKYAISQNGTKYIEEHPDLPQFKMTENQAASIYRLLNGQTYECAPPFTWGTDFHKLYDLMALTKTKDGYVLTPDGQDAFERTTYGDAHIRRIAENELRERVNEKVREKLGVGVTPLNTAKQLREAAKIAKRMKATEYAEEILLKAASLEQKERVESLIAPLLGSLSPDRISVEADDEGRVKIVIIYNGSGISNGSNVYATRGPFYANGNDYYVPFYVSSSYGGVGYSNERTHAPALDYIERLQVAMAICDVLNTQYLTPETQTVAIR